MFYIATFCLLKKFILVYAIGCELEADSYEVFIHTVFQFPTASRCMFDDASVREERSRPGQAKSSRRMMLGDDVLT